VGRQGCMFGRCNICVTEPRQRIALPPECQFRRPAKKRDQRYQSPNFLLLAATRPEVAMLMAAMVQARDAVERRSWSHPQEPTGEEWWADVLADLPV
jgi:hypothetical protein